MDRYLLLAATFCFFIGFAHTLLAVGAGRYRPTRFNLAVITAGFVLQTLFLHERGQKIGRCPLTNLFEVIIFLCWSIVLLYMIVGPAYRVSLLGAFTSPMVFTLQIFAMLAPIDQHAVGIVHGPVDVWLELHAALSVIAYGAFGLAGVAGSMYLLQDYQLKSRHFGKIFYHLPPVHELGLVNHRLLIAGFALLTLGLLAGFGVRGGANGVKIAMASGIWIFYGLIIQSRWTQALPPRRVAILSVVAFFVALGSLWGIEFLGA